MNYINNEHLGGFLSELASAAQAGYNYYNASVADREQQTTLAVANAEDTAVARYNQQQAGYAANRAVLQSEIDAEKQKRYLIIGASVGIPLIALMLLKRKGRSL